MRGLENRGCFLVTMLNGCRSAMSACIRWERNEDGNIVVIDMRALVVTAIDRTLSQRVKRRPERTRSQYLTHPIMSGKTHHSGRSSYGTL